MRTLVLSAIGCFATTPPPALALASPHHSSGAVTFFDNREDFDRNCPTCNKEDFEQTDPTAAGGLALHAEPLWVCSDDVGPPPVAVPGDIRGGLGVVSSGGQGVYTIQAGLIFPTDQVAGAKEGDNATFLDFCVEPRCVGFDLWSGNPLDPMRIIVFDCDGNILGATRVTADLSASVFVGIAVDAACPPIWRISIESESQTGEAVDNVVWDGQCDCILSANRKDLDAAGDNVTLALSELPAVPTNGLLFIRCIDQSPFDLNLGLLPIATDPTCLGPLATPAVPPGTSVGIAVFLLDDREHQADQQEDPLLPLIRPSPCTPWSAGSRRLPPPRNHAPPGAARRRARQLHHRQAHGAARSRARPRGPRGRHRADDRDRDPSGERADDSLRRRGASLLDAELDHDGDGAHRAAAHRAGEALVLYTTPDDGRVLRHERRGSDRRTQTIYRGL